MATRVSVKNFQSIKEAHLMVDGFTVVTGKNNSGKTALQRAIRGVFENTRGNSFVRTGEDSCEVTLSFEDGNKVTWIKGKKDNKYIVNGKTFDKVGQGVPEEVSDLGVHAIQCGTKQITPQMAPQFTGQVFLLNESGSVLAEAVSDVERVSTLNKALKVSERDKRSSSSELKVRVKDKAELEKSLEAYDGLEEVGLHLQALQLQEDTLKDLNSEIQELESLLSDYRRAVRITTSLQGVDNLQIPVADALVEGRDNLLSLERLSTGLARSSKGSLTIKRMLDSVSSHQGTLDDSRLVTINRVQGGIDLLSDYFSSLKDTQDTISQVKSSIKKAETDLGLIRDQIHSVLENHSDCPLCGSDL